jgi:hypothetical protein
VIAPALAVALLGTGALSVKLTPARALAATGDPVLLDVSADGAPPDARLTATTNAGTLGAPRPAGPNRFRLSFTPPRERFPQVALVRLELEHGTDRESTWVAIPVDGSETLTLETTKPHAKVDVTIGGKTFGPVQADARGQVEVKVVVPPGITTASVRSVDRLGNQKVKSIDLAPPPFPLARLAIPAGASASWADVKPLPVEVFAIDPSGAPADAPPALQTSHGSLDAPVPGPVPGAFEATLRPLDKLPPDRRATITAAGAEPLVVPLRAGPPVQIAVSAEPAAYTAGSHQKIAVSAHLADARRNASDSTTGVRFTTNLGTLEPSGPQAAALVLPDVFSGRESVEVAAAAGDVDGKAAVELRAGPPVSAKATLALPAARAGEPPVDGTLLLADAFGNPVRGASPALSCTVGHAELVRELGGGAYQFRFGAEAADRTGAGKLLARVGGGPELPAGDVLVIPAPADFGISLGLRAGAQSNFARLHGGGGLAEVAVRPMGRVPLEVLVEAGGSSLLTVRQPYAAAGAGASIATDLRWASGAAGIRVSFGVGPVMALHAALSGGAQYTWAAYQVSGGGAPTLSLSDAGLGPFARVAAGVTYRAGPGRLLGELQATYTPPPSSTALGGNLGQVTAMVGYLVEIR